MIRKYFFRKYLYTSILILVSFFFIPTVKAETTYTISNTCSTPTTADIEKALACRSSIESLISQNSTWGSNYMIYYDHFLNYQVFVFRTDSTFPFITGNNNFEIRNSSANINFMYDINSCTRTGATNTLTRLQNVWRNGGCNYPTPLYISGNAYISATTNTYVFSYSSYTKTISQPDGTVELPSLYSLIYSEPPIPPDNFPILTSFFNTFIDRLGFLIEEFSSNYIYLSIFTVFIFIFILELIKRRLF